MHVSKTKYNHYYRFKHRLAAIAAEKKQFIAICVQFKQVKTSVNRTTREVCDKII